MYHPGTEWLQSLHKAWTAVNTDSIVDRLGDFEIRLFGVAPAVVDFTDVALPTYGSERAAVVRGVDPLTDVRAVAVDRKGFASDGVCDELQHEVFGVLARPNVDRGTREYARLQRGTQRLDSQIGSASVGSNARSSIRATAARTSPPVISCGATNTGTGTS